MAEGVGFEPTVAVKLRSISSRVNLLCKSKSSTNYLRFLGVRFCELQSESVAGGVKTFAELAKFHIEMKRKKGMSAKHVCTLKSFSDSFAEQFGKNVAKLPVPMRTDYNEPCFLRSHQFKSQPAVVTTLTESGNSAGMLGGLSMIKCGAACPCRREPVSVDVLVYRKHL